MTTTTSTTSKHVTVTHARTFIPGVIEVRWKDGRRRRHLFTAITDWTTADEQIAHAVTGRYAGQHVTVDLPIKAWWR